MPDIVERLRHVSREKGATYRPTMEDEVADEIERLRFIEAAARRFVGEADSHARYITVRTWATPEADPYLNLRSALDLKD